MKKTLIVSGGEIDLEFLMNTLNEGVNNIIAVDKGLEALNKINLSPNYIIGDFDSVRKEILEKYNRDDIKIIKLNPEKDYSDTHMALKLAIELKSNEVYIVGALGNRIDHAIANIHVMKEALDIGIKCKIIDKNNNIELITTGENQVQKTEYKYVSLIPLTTQVTGITLKGFKYPLVNAQLSIGHSIGVSNEIIKQKATIVIKEGILIQISSKD